MKFRKQSIVCSSTWSVDHISGRCSDRILSVIRIKRVHSVHDLGEIIFCLCAPGLILDGFERWEKQADQDHDDPDDEEQLDESKGVGASARGTHGANASRKLADAHVKCLERLKGKELKN